LLNVSRRDLGQHLVAEEGKEMRFEPHLAADPAIDLGPTSRSG
jgi:hypothetical protein